MMVSYMIIFCFVIRKHKLSDLSSNWSATVCSRIELNHVMQTNNSIRKQLMQVAKFKTNPTWTDPWTAQLNTQRIFGPKIPKQLTRKIKNKIQINHTSPNLGPQASRFPQNTHELHKQGPPLLPHIPLQAIQHSREEFILCLAPHFTASPQSSKCSNPLQQTSSSISSAPEPPLSFSTKSKTWLIAVLPVDLRTAGSQSKTMQTDTIPNKKRTGSNERHTFESVCRRPIWGWRPNWRTQE